ncbi:Cytochrome P450 monooxygenase iccF [Cladobotryum mycophilum]|uniref:Cytochrome P450 monooxygenase iccF n=1 Tax=Cladobotryum mycophilum TaxID=491253 RepID=A0ABR0SWD8_9HYPO
MTDYLSQPSSAHILGLGLGLGVFAFAALFILDFISSQKYLQDVAVVGRGRGFINRLKDGRDYMWNYRAWMIDGHNRYNKKGLPFIAPGPLTRKPEIILPQSQLAWMFDQPDHIISAQEARYDMTYPQYNFLGHRLAFDQFGFRVVYKSLARHLPTALPEIDQEIQQAAGRALGNDTENWKTANLMGFWMSIVPYVTNRLLVGPELCREKKFLDEMVGFATATAINIALLNQIPKFFHPIFGRILAIRNWRHWRNASEQVLPLIRERLHAMTRQAAGDAEYKDYTPHEDFLTWLIRLAIAEERTFELDPIVISKRLLPIEFASIHTTVLTGQLWTLDLLASDPQTGILDTLREELRAHRPESRAWDKVSLSSLVRLDSSIRESMRYSNFSVTPVKRLVITKEGVHNPDLGMTFPRGTILVANLQGIHHDADIFENSDAYDPLRYSREREAWDRKSDDEKQSDPAEGARVRGFGSVTTSDTHLTFSHGRHACPGRFFVAYELKLIMAYLLLNYDIKLVGEPLEKKFLGAGIVPPVRASMQIRRKKAAA